MDDPAGRKSVSAQRIVVVGPCASGKSTLVERLRAAGLDARASGQEHSAVRDLWAKLEPDLLVALDIDLETLRARRSPHWPEDIYLRQRERLRHAFEVADLVIDTMANDAEAVANVVIDAARGKLPEESGSE
jgi:GTPase SAR1 family protein